MAESTIGLDFGHKSLKAVHLRRGFRGIEWVKSVERKWPAERNPLDWFSLLEGSKGLEGEARSSETVDAVLRVVQEVLGEFSVRRANLIVSVPAHLCSIRTVTLPFSDERRLVQVVPFEVESQLPYPLEELVIDHQPLVAENGNTRLLVAALPKKTLEPFLTLLSRAGIDPSTVELDAMAMYTLSMYGLEAGTHEGIALVDIGAVKTLVVVMDQGTPRFARSFLLGGRQWTQAVMKALTLPSEEAEEKIHRIGLANGMSGALALPMTAWIEELNRTLRVAQQECGQVIGRVILCGGGAHLKGIERLVTESLGLEVGTLDLPLLKNKDVKWDSTWSLALGLALRGGGGRQTSRVNFRKGEFAYQEEIKHSRKKARWFWVGLGFLLLLFGADLALKYRIQAQRYDEAKSGLRETYRDMLPEVKNVVDELHQAQTSLEGFRRKLALFGQDQTRPLRILAEFTTRIPEGIDIEVRELSIESERVRVQAETESFEAVDKIKAAIEASDRFHEAEISNAKILSDKGRVRFDLKVRISPPGGEN